MASPHHDIGPTNLFGDQLMASDTGISTIPAEEDGYDPEIASLTFNLPPPFDWPGGDGNETEDEDVHHHNPNSSVAVNESCAYISDSFFSPPDDSDSYHTARSPDDHLWTIEGEDSTAPFSDGGGDEESFDLYSEIRGANDTNKKFTIYGVEISFGCEDFASLSENGTESLAKYFDVQHAAKIRAKELNVCPLLEGEMVSLAINAYCTRRSLELQKLTKIRQSEQYRGYKEKYGEEASKQMEARRKWKEEQENKYRLKWKKQREEEDYERRMLEEEKKNRMKAREGKELDEWEEMAEVYIDWLDEMQLELIKSKRGYYIDTTGWED